MTTDQRRQQWLVPDRRLLTGSTLMGLIRHALSLAVVGVLIGLACWPLNVVDRLQTRLYGLMPTDAGAWSTAGMVLALLPVVVMPVLLVLQQGAWKEGAGSGIPSTVNALDDPASMPKAMALRGTLQRGWLWSIASLSLIHI